jgi:hypothetical protein
MVSSLLNDPLPDTIPLTTREKQLKAELEAVVEHGLDEFLKVGNALANLRNKRLYRCEFPTFAEYVRTRFNLARSTADQLIRSSQTAEALIEDGINLPPRTTEASIRPISSLPTLDLQSACWKLAESFAPARGGAVTEPLVSRLCHIVRDCLDGVDTDDHAPLGGNPDPKRRRESPERETPFIRPVERLAAWSGFSVEIVISSVTPPSAATVYRACGKLADRCHLVQRRLEALYPQLVQ